MGAFLGGDQFDDDGNVMKVAGEFLYSLPTFSTEHGGSLRLRTMWHRHCDNFNKGFDGCLSAAGAGIAVPNYQKDRQEILLVKKHIPCPVRFAYNDNDNYDYFAPIIEFGINIEKFAKYHKVPNKQKFVIGLGGSGTFTGGATVTQRTTGATGKIWKTATSTTHTLYDLGTQTIFTEACTYEDSTTITNTLANPQIVVGKIVSGSNIPAGAVIVSITDPNNFVISEATTGGSTSATVTFGGTGGGWATTDTAAYVIDSSEGADTSSLRVTSAVNYPSVTLRRSFNVCFATIAPKTGQTFADYIKYMDESTYEESMASHNYNYISLMCIPDSGMISVWASGTNQSSLYGSSQSPKYIDSVFLNEGLYDDGDGVHAAAATSRLASIDLLTSDTPLKHNAMNIGQNYRIQISPSIEDTTVSYPYMNYRIIPEFEGTDSSADTTDATLLHVPNTSNVGWDTFQREGFGDGNTTWPSVMTIWLCNTRPLKHPVAAGAGKMDEDSFMYYANGHHNSGTVGVTLNDMQLTPDHFGQMGSTGSPGAAIKAIDTETGVGKSEEANPETVLYISNIKFKDFNLLSNNATVTDNGLIPSQISIPPYQEKGQSSGTASSSLYTDRPNLSFLFYGVNTSEYLSGDGNEKYIFFNGFQSNNPTITELVNDNNIFTGYSHDENLLGEIGNANTYEHTSGKNGLEYSTGTSSASENHITGRASANDIESFTRKGFMKLDWPITGLNGATGAPFIKRENPLFSSRILEVKSLNAAGGSIIRADNTSVFNNNDDEEYIVYKHRGYMTDDTGAANGYPVAGSSNKIITDVDESVSPVVVTSSSHGFVTGDMVLIRSVGGTTQINDIYFYVGTTTTNTFELNGTPDSYTAYTSGGTARHCSPDFRITQVLERVGDTITFNNSLKYGEYFYNANFGDFYTASKIAAHEKSSTLMNTTRFWDVLISPFRYWLFQEIKNSSSTTGETINPSAIYTSAIITADKGTPGATFREWLYSDDREHLNDWTLIPDEGNDVLEMGTDYGYGSIDDVQKELSKKGIEDVGFVSRGNSFSIGKYEEFKMPNIVKMDSPNVGDDVTLFMSPFYASSSYMTMHSKTGTYPPLLVSIFEDDVPKISDFIVKPNEENPFYPEYTWECGEDDLWYGFIIVNDKGITNQYHNALLHFPFNEEGDHGKAAAEPFEKIANSDTNVDVYNCKYDLEGLGGHCLRFDGTDDAVKYGTGSETWTANLSEASFIAHLIPESGSAQEYILYQSGTVTIQITNADKILVQLNWDSDSFVLLESSSLITRDGEIPTNVIVTFDKNLTSGNAKLFIDGKLEDQSGRVILADEASPVGGSTGWLHAADLGSVGSNYLFLGSDAASSSLALTGRLEEIVIYNKAIYPFTGKDSTFIFTKPVSELTDTENSSSKSYVAKIFIKDYHNIRGTTSREVATHPQISFRKAGFFLDNS